MTSIASPPDGSALHELARTLFPLPRSLTGRGVRETLSALEAWAPLATTEVPAGAQVYDWIVPPEWNIAEAWIADPSGRRIVDLAASSLHVVGYSAPVRARISGAELDQHLHSLPDRPDLIPYRTSYYERTWGFCLPHAVRATIDPGAEYEVLIDSTLDAAGSLTYGEAVIEGRTADEILISTYVCHPALANDNLSGVVVAAGLARSLEAGELRHTVRILFSPTGVGVLAWLQRNEAALGSLRAGLVVACAGDPGPLTYKRSRRGDTIVDRAAVHVLGRRPGARVLDFVPWGTDERQFCSPGFDLPVGALTRTPNGMYPAYHTSADDLELITPGALADTLDALLEVVRTIDGAVRFERVEARGEPHLSRHGIDGRMTGSVLAGSDEGRRSLFWLLNLADGRHDLLEIADRAGVPMLELAELASSLESAAILQRG